MDYAGAELLKFALSAVVMALLYRYVEKQSRYLPEEREGRRELRYVGMVACIGWVCVIFFGMCMYFSSKAPPDKAPAWVPYLFAGFVLMGLVLIFWTRERYLLDETGLERRGIGAGVRIPWSEVAQVDISAAYDGIMLTGRGGETLRVSSWIQGYSEVLRILLERMPKDARIDVELALELWERAGMALEAFDDWAAPHGFEKLPPDGING